jgi:hypothetical protein
MKYFVMGYETLHPAYKELILLTGQSFDTLSAAQHHADTQIDAEFEPFIVQTTGETK